MGRRRWAQGLPVVVDWGKEGNLRTLRECWSCWWVNHFYLGAEERKRRRGGTGGACPSYSLFLFVVFFVSLEKI